MVEGDYFGVLEPNVHYIPIKADFSNLDEILDLIEHDKSTASRLHGSATNTWSRRVITLSALCQ